MAVIIEKLNAIFFLSPGTGSTSLSELLVGGFGGVWAVSGIEGKHATPEKVSALGYDLKKYTCFTTTRHPLDFYISQYHKKRTWPGDHEEFKFARANDFSAFLDRQFAKQPDGFIHPIFLRAADVVLRKECLLDDFNSLLERLGHERVENIPKINVSDGLIHDFSVWYSDADIARAIRKHRAHFEFFGYSINSMWPKKSMIISSVVTDKAMGGVRDEKIIIESQKLTNFMASLKAQWWTKIISRNESVEVEVELCNQSPDYWRNTGNKPVQIGYRWFSCVDEEQLSDVRRTRLPRDVGPNESLSLFVHVPPPSRVGIYRLRISLVQEHVSWFDSHGTGYVDLDVEVR